MMAAMRMMWLLLEGGHALLDIHRRGHVVGREIDDGHRCGDLRVAMYELESRL